MKHIRTGRVVGTLVITTCILLGIVWLLGHLLLAVNGGGGGDLIASAVPTSLESVSSTVTGVVEKATDSLTPGEASGDVAELESNTDDNSGETEYDSANSRFDNVADSEADTFDVNRRFDAGEPEDTDSKLALEPTVDEFEDSNRFESDSPAGIRDLEERPDFTVGTPDDEDSISPIFEGDSTSVTDGGLTDSLADNGFTSGDIDFGAAAGAASDLAGDVAGDVATKLGDGANAAISSVRDAAQPLVGTPPADSNSAGFNPIGSAAPAAPNPNGSAALTTDAANIQATVPETPAIRPEMTKRQIPPATAPIKKTYPVRTWTSADRKQVEASFVRLEDVVTVAGGVENTVILSVRGKLYRVPVSRFSQPDQDYLAAIKQETVAQ